MNSQLLPLIQNAHTPASDQDLLNQFYESRDNAWLGLLLQKYTLLLYGVSMKYLKNPEEAKDAVQQIFLKAIVELNKYPVTYFSSWIYMIARNYCLMQLRNQHRKTILPPSEQLADPGESSFSELFEKETTIRKLESAMLQLNPEQQQCVQLFYLQKKSYQEIVDITGYTLLKVKSYIQNGKRNLRLLMEKNAAR